MFNFLNANIFVQFGGLVFFFISMANCSPLFAELFLYSFKADSKRYHSKKKISPIPEFLLFFRYT